MLAFQIQKVAVVVGDESKLVCVSYSLCGQNITVSRLF
jgi:hypothetical protein